MTRQTFKFLLMAAILFTALPVLANEPITSQRCNEFTFDASSSYDPDNENISVFWDFGDGSTSTEPVIDHTYDKSGIYNVTLSIADNSGLECSTALSEQKVLANIAPIAHLEGAPKNICVKDIIELNASKSSADDNKKLAYQWNFGDGTAEGGQTKVKKSYNKGGKYKIQLTVDDKAGTPCSVRSIESTLNVNEPPVAQAGEEEVLVCISADEDMDVAFDASASADPNRDKLKYNWDFGDGRKDSGVKVSHKFRSLGNYDVKLVVDDGSALSCSTAVDFVRVKLNKAPKADAGKDILACPDENLIFDGTSSYAHIKGTLGGTWDFGDGATASGLKVSHTYTKAGQYQARLTVENKLNAQCPASSDMRTVTINARPTVSINSPKSICLGAIVNFDASTASDSDGDNLEYYWSFGDGTILRSGAKVSHEYKAGGLYKVSVIVDDGRATNCSTATAHTQVKVNTPPVADAGTNLTCCVDKPTTFDATGSSDPDGDRLTYNWEFGDGGSNQGAVISHTYTKSGSYNVKVTVDDNSGTSCSSATAGFVAEANSTPVPIIKVR